MSEQDDASVNRFLDGLDDRRDEVAGEDERRRSRRARPQWEYTMWWVTEAGTERAQIVTVDGAVTDPTALPFYQRVVEAGRQGWELVSVSEQVMYFKRPKVGD